MTPTTRHNLINAAIILLPTILVYVVYFLSGGNFERNHDLGFATFVGFLLSSFAVSYVDINRGGWK